MEDYLTTIYILASEGGPVIGARVAERLGVAAPTVTDAIKRLTKQGYVVIGDRHEIALTSRGHTLAEQLVRRHRIAERWLTDGLGLDWATCHAEARSLEHALSVLVTERLYEQLGRPATCPHGNPIPGSGQPDTTENWETLDHLQAGQRGYVRRIAERAEDDGSFLGYLQANGLVPGASLMVVEIAPPHGPLILDVQGRMVALGLDAARDIWVEHAGL
jgi:DtxR family Mn-dependent transcriptional regulator